MSVYWLTKVQEQSGLHLQCLSKRLQNISAYDKSRQLCCIGALRVDKCEFVFIYGHDFHEMHAHLRGSNNLLTMLNLDQIINIT